MFKKLTIFTALFPLWMCMRHHAHCKILHCANLSNFKFFLSNFNASDYTIVFCSKMIEDSQYVVGEIDCNRNESDFVYAISATELMDNLPSNCIVNQTVRVPVKQNRLHFKDVVLKALSSRTIVMEWKALAGCYHCEKSRELLWVQHHK
ncbi:hypothetical protein Patl1_15138 [Pistacia atlantica]|uniref:Uncharacterized protein n=1 Tax=Pistacia atlantica TaxID=434234 RepID=A0ACC1BBA1_9ROSI|nr:hypothetical protein Patl1_15138 [Pistacia atlantica]